MFYYVCVWPTATQACWEWRRESSWKIGFFMFRCTRLPNWAAQTCFFVLHKTKRQNEPELGMNILCCPNPPAPLASGPSLPSLPTWYRGSAFGFPSCNHYKVDHTVHFALFCLFLNPNPGLRATLSAQFVNFDPRNSLHLPA